MKLTVIQKNQFCWTYRLSDAKPEPSNDRLVPLCKRTPIKQARIPERCAVIKNIAVSTRTLYRNIRQHSPLEPH